MAICALRVFFRPVATDSIDDEVTKQIATHQIYTCKYDPYDQTALGSPTAASLLYALYADISNPIKRYMSVAASSQVA